MTSSWRTALAIIPVLGACNDFVGPDRPDGTLLAAGSLALEWSADGSEIFYYDSGYSHRVSKPLPDRILAVNVATRATRVVVSSGAYGFAGYASNAPQGMPPRVTVAGLAYLRFTGDQMALHVVTDTGDIALGSSGPWFTTTPDRSRLLYSRAGGNALDDSVGVIDLVTGARTVIGTGPYHPTIGNAISPDGNQLVVVRQDVEAGFAILHLSNGTIVALPDSLFPNQAAGRPVLLGWNATGVWFVQYGGPPHLIRYTPSTGAADRFTIGDTSGGTRVVTGGAALPAGSSIVWSQNCNASHETGDCDVGAYALWLMNPLTGVDKQLVSANYVPDAEFPYVFFAAPSPNGQSLAYLLGNELRLLALQ